MKSGTIRTAEVTQLTAGFGYSVDFVREFRSRSLLTIPLSVVNGVSGGCTGKIGGDGSGRPVDTGERMKPHNELTRPPVRASAQGDGRRGAGAPTTGAVPGASAPATAATELDRRAAAGVAGKDLRWSWLIGKARQNRDRAIVTSGFLQSGRRMAAGNCVFGPGTCCCCSNLRTTAAWDASIRRANGWWALIPI